MNIYGFCFWFSCSINQEEAATLADNYKFLNISIKSQADLEVNGWVSLPPKLWPFKWRLLKKDALYLSELRARPFILLMECSNLKHYLYTSPSNAFKNGTDHFLKVSKWRTLLQCDRSGRQMLTNGFQALGRYFPVMLYLVLYEMVPWMVLLIIIVLLFFLWSCYDCVLGSPNFQV